MNSKKNQINHLQTSEKIHAHVMSIDAKNAIQTSLN